MYEILFSVCGSFIWEGEGEGLCGIMGFLFAV